MQNKLSFSKKLSVTLVLLFFTVLGTLCGCSRLAGKSENQKFEQFTNTLFLQQVTSNSVTLHYTLKDPDAYRISDVPITFGSIGTDSASVCAAAENANAVLETYHYDKLSPKNQLTYDVLHTYLKHSLTSGEYLLYEEPLTPMTGTQSQLPVILSEYQFYDEEDVNTYLELLKDFPNYFHDLIAFEEAKSAAGLFMPSYSADHLITECNAFIQMENHYLISSFDERIDALQLNPSVSEDYKKQNRDTVKQLIFPSYQELIDCLTKLRDSGENQRGLCGLPNGKQFYELSVQSQTGSDKTIPELQELTRKQILSDLTELHNVLSADEQALSATSDLFNTNGYLLESNAPTDILNLLKNDISDTFPAPAGADFQIKYVSDAMEEYLSPAFYMIPPIDDSENNVIYINSGHIADDVSLFTTLAHEGYPGHLYQTTYYAATNPDPLRALLDFGGYTEGWATYCEMLSYYYLPIPKENATLMQRNASVLLGLYALTDMGIHYDGWGLTDTVALFRNYGITDADTIERVYDLIIADPGNYLKYYIGYVEFLELKKDAMAAWGDAFTQERFHKAVLDAGPAPFSILRKQLGLK